MTAGDESDLVRRGYDALSYHYRGDDAEEDDYGPFTAREFVPEGDRGHELFWARRPPG